MSPSFYVSVSKRGGDVCYFPDFLVQVFGGFE